MDRETIQQLKNTYKEAPSSALAQLIFKQLGNDSVELENWANECHESLPSEDLFNLAQWLTDSDLPEIALLLINPKDFSQLDLWLKLQTNNWNISTINSILEFHEKNNKDVSHLRESIEKTSASKQKSKLKVVEKLDYSEITDLQRYRQKSTDFSDVVGLESIKKQIHRKIILPFQKPSLFKRFKKKVGGGVLLYGPPGCGKTLLARATAGECSASFFNVEISDILDMYIGESEQKLHAIFEKARQETPSVLFFDEFEALAGKRENQGNRTSSQLVSQFLTELDGFSQNNSGVLVLASTNVPWSIDSAFLRPGRFDRMFFVPPPDQTARQFILEHYLKDRPAESDINFSYLAAQGRAFSGADLFNWVEMATEEAIDESIELDRDVLISQNHFKVAFSETRSTTIEWLTTARNYARYANDGGRYNEVIKFLQKHGKK
jgi:ATP-dependent 26S proteasome regulatory subunit